MYVNKPIISESESLHFDSGELQVPLTILFIGNECIHILKAEIK